MKIHYVIALHFIRWLTNFYYFTFKWTATAAIGIHPTKAWLSQLVIFKNAIWTWGHIRRTICNKKIFFLTWKKCHRNVWNASNCFGPSCMNRASVSEWHERVKKAASLWGMIRGVGGVRTSIYQSWLNKGLGLGLVCWGFKGVQVPSEKASTLQIESVAFTAVYNSILVTDYLTKMDFKTAHHPPYSPDLAPCDFCLFPKLKSCRYETIEELKEAVTKVIDTLTQEDFHGALQK